MSCKGILRYSLEIPDCFTENNEVMRREVITCRLKKENCPKNRGKNRITERCWRIKDE
jgi:hypothetical protein